MATFNATSAVQTLGNGSNNTGNDTFNIPSGSVQAGDVFNGGTGTDTLSMGNNITINFSVATITAMERLQFGNGGSATFNASQFGGSLISDSLTVLGAGGSQAVIINNASNFSAASWTFGSWTSGTDTISINGTSGNDTITGSSEVDTITGGGGADTINAGGGDDIINIANGQFVAGESISGGGGVDSIVLTNATTVDFSAGTVNSVGRLTGSSGNDAVIMSGLQWAGFSTSINLGGGANDTLSVVASGDISALGIPSTISNIETGNLIGTAGTDTVTLTGAQLNAIIIGSGTINLGLGLGDTINLTSTSSDLNSLGATNASIQGVEAISAATAAAGVTINLGGQGEDFTITGSGQADTITGGSGVDIINAGGGADTINGGGGADTINAGGGNDTINIANGQFVAGESIDGGGGVNSIVLTNATTVDFSSGTVTSVGRLTGSGGNDAVTMSALQWAGFTTAINLGGGANDTLNVVASSDISALGIPPTLNNIETGNLTGTTGTDTITLTGAQLDAIIIGTGTINLGAGLGDTIDLTSTSADLNTLGATNASIQGVEAISAATAAAGVIINLSGQSEGFTITGSAQADTITGGTGADMISAGGGNDAIDGGADNDAAIYTGAWLNYTITQTGSTYIITDNLGSDGTDTVTNVENFTFSNGTFTAAQILNDAPEGANDDNLSDAVVEAGGIANAAPGDASAIGNVLANDIDPDTPLGDSITVTGVRAGTEGAGGALTAVSGATTIDGTYGSLVINADGSYSYTLDNDDTDTQALTDGASATDSFTYRVADAKGATDLAQIDIAITGANDAAVLSSDTRNLTETNLAADISTSGTLTVSDVDSSETFQTQAGTVGLYGTFAIDAAGAWTFTASSAHDAFVAGTTYTDTFNVLSADGTATSVTINILGTNDAAVVSSDTGNLTNFLSSLTAAQGFKIIGENASDIAGRSVSSAGDVNGDGFDDLIVGANGNDAGGGAAGAAYVIFGKASGFGTVDLDVLGAATPDNSVGFKIVGEAAGDQAGISVSSAGDVNGDGFDDLIVGGNNNYDVGGAYVIFGKASGFGTINLDDVAVTSTGGFKIVGEVAGDQAGISVSSAGDVNGDGFDDLIVGAVGKYAAGTKAGAGYVVFGKATGFGTVDLDVLGGATPDNSVGFKIVGEAALDRVGISVSSAGDLNGDGFDELIVGANGNDAGGGDYAGAAYVIFGKASGFGTVDLDVLGAAIPDNTVGFKIVGEAAVDQAGFSVSSAGDVNGDGFDDLIVGAVGNGGNTGAAYVIFGKATGFGTVNLDVLGAATPDNSVGFKIIGENASDLAGYSVSSAGDVNGDGFDDLIVGANGNGGNAGAAYVIFGKASGFGTIDLEVLAGPTPDNTVGFKIVGEAAGDLAGISVSAAGDVDGDGFDDLIVGAHGNDAGGVDAGAGYVLFGGDFSDPRELTETNLATDISTSGMLTVSDVDSSETFQTQAGTVGLYGTFAIDAAGAWTFTASSAHDAFVAGTTYTDTFNVLSADGTATSVTINILGTNDAPVISGTATGSVMEDALSLGAPTVFASGGDFPIELDVADVNGDGNADIVVANHTTQSVAVLLGDGSGGFAAPLLNAMGFRVDQALVADMDGDGDADIVTANGISGGGSVSVLLGDGTGAFAAPATYATGLGYTQLASVADVNGDGNLDIIASGDAGLAVFLNDGSGGFGAANFYNPGVATPASNTVVDVDGDGDGDIITAGLLSNTIAVLLNDGSGVFGAPTVYAAGGLYPQNLVAADVNGDGFADIVTANGLSDDVSVLLNNGLGGFGPATAYGVGADFPGDVSVADVNGDGFVDIVTPNVAASNDPGDNEGITMSVLLGDGSGAFAAPVLFDVGSLGPQHSKLADVNGDGLVDVITSNAFSDNLSVLLNTGSAPAVTGTLTATDVDTGDSQTWSIQGSPTGTYGSLTLNGNSGEWIYTLANASTAVQSLAAGESHDETFTVRVTDGAGGYDEQIVTVTVTGVNDAPVIGGTSQIGGSVTEDAGGPLEFGAATAFSTGGGYPFGFAVGDVNGDGNADIVTANHLGENVAVLLGDGSGGFAAASTFGLGFRVDSATVADVNGDGKLDIVTANGSSGGGSISVLLGDGTGAFAAPATDATGVGHTGLATLTDLDGDSDLDIVAGGTSGLAVLLNDGFGEFSLAATYPTGVYQPASNTVIDVDGDGDGDIITAGLLTNDIAVLLNDGNGVFGAPTFYAAGGLYPQNVVAVDVNGDGFADIVTANGLSDDVSVLLADGSGGFGPASTYSVGADVPGDVSVADVNGDGFVDIVTPNVAASNDPGDNEGITMSVLLGDGLGGFGAPTLFDVNGTGPHNSVLADVNGDGLVDVITTNVTSNDLSVLLNTGGNPVATGTMAASDVDTGATLTWSGSAAGTYGSLAITAAGVWTYTLDNASAAVQSLAEGDSETETFTVTVTDEFGAADTETVTITVNGTNDAPANNAPDANNDVWVQSDLTPIAAGIIAASWFTHNDTDADGNPVFVTAVSGLPAGLTANYDVSGHLIDITGTSPVAGTYALSYTLSDGSASDTATVTLTVLDTTTGANTITLDGNDFSYIDGLDGGDTITGDITLSGNAGIDTFIGNIDNDVLSGGAGNDSLSGGTGNDNYNFAVGDGMDTITDSGNADSINIAAAALSNLNFERVGNDLVINYGASDQITVIDDFIAGSGVEQITFSGGSVFGYGLGAAARNLSTGLTGSSSDNDVIIGTSTGETLNGGAGDFNDLLFGNGGNDTLIGGDGADLLVGGDGDDILVGDRGADALVGGSGDDTFRYVAVIDSALRTDGGLLDTVTDFTAGGTVDEIDLDAFNFSGAAIADLKETSSGAFTSVTTADFFDAPGGDLAVVVEYFNGGARVYVDVNGDGNLSVLNDLYTADDLVIELNNIEANSLTTSDFIF